MYAHVRVHTHPYLVIPSLVHHYQPTVITDPVQNKMSQ